MGRPRTTESPARCWGLTKGEGETKINEKKRREQWLRPDRSKTGRKSCHCTKVRGGKRLGEKKTREKEGKRGRKNRGDKEKRLGMLNSDLGRKRNATIG